MRLQQLAVAADRVASAGIVAPTPKQMPAPTPPTVERAAA
jgi:hypothetical protein